MKLWLVKRFIVEEFEVEAETRREAFNKLEDSGGSPFAVTVTRETCVSRDWYNEHKNAVVKKYQQQG